MLSALRAIPRALSVGFNSQSCTAMVRPAFANHVQKIPRALSAGLNSQSCTAMVRPAFANHVQKRTSMTHATECLTLAAAEAIIDRAIGIGREKNLKPLCVVVLDSGGTVIASKREDGASFMRFDVAMAKAYGCPALGISMRSLRDGGSNPSGPWGTWGPQFVNSVVSISHGKIAPVPGGILIKSLDKVHNIGAVGVSGDTSDNDEQCALAGVEATGLASDPCWRIGV